MKSPETVALGKPTHLVVPESFEPLPPDLQGRVRTLCSAAAELERGEAGHSVDLAWTAFESSIIWAIRVSGFPLPRSKRGEEHHDRKEWAISELALRRHQVYGLHKLAMVGAYGSQNTIDPTTLVDPSQARRAIERVSTWLPIIARYPGTLTTAQLRTLDDSIALRDVSTAHLSDAELMEIVGSGIYDSPLVATFHAMLRRYSRPHTQRETELAANLAFYAAHQAVNQGICAGPNSSFLWTQRARELGADVNTAERNAHLDRLDSIAFELLGDNPSALRFLLSAKEHASGLSHMTATMANREARVRAKLGDFARAQEAVAIAMAEVESTSDPTVLARRHLTLGIVSSLNGDHRGGILHLEEGLALHRTHQVITKANGTMYLMDACKRAGELDKAIYYAKIARSIAERYGYRYNLRRIDRFERRLLGTRR